MKQYIIAVFLLAMLFACGDTSNSGNAKKVLDGSQIYTKYCVLCHGKDGTQQLNGAFNLPESKLTLEERMEVIANGRKLMAPYKSVLSEQEIRAVAAYTMQLKKAQ